MLAFYDGPTLEVCASACHDSDSRLIRVWRKDPGKIGWLNGDTECVVRRQDGPHMAVHTGGARIVGVLQLLNEGYVVVLRAMSTVPRKELREVVAKVVLVQSTRTFFEGQEPFDTLSRGLSSLGDVVEYRSSEWTSISAMGTSAILVATYKICASS